MDFDRKPSDYGASEDWTPNPIIQLCITAAIIGGIYLIYILLK